MLLPNYKLSDIKLNVLGTMEDSDFGKEILPPQATVAKSYRHNLGDLPESFIVERQIRYFKRLLRSYTDNADKSNMRGIIKTLEMRLNQTKTR